MRSFFTTGILVLAGLLIGCHVERDRADAKAVAQRVHGQMQSGEYSIIYRESAPRFKTVGTEAQFVSMMQQMRKESGSLRKANEIAYHTGFDTNIGVTHTLFYDLECEHGLWKEQLILTRSDKGQMRLWKLGIGPME